VRVTVIGGLGFVGVNLCLEFLNRGYDIIVVDNWFRASWLVPIKLLNNIQILDYDMRDNNVIDEIVKKIKKSDIVINLAANASGIVYSSANQIKMFSDNTLLSINGANLAMKLNSSKYVYFSSSCVYSDDAPKPTSEEFGHIGTPENGNKGYGWAKRFGEVQASLLNEYSGISSLIIRPVNIFGPGEHYDLTIGHVIPSLIMKAFNTTELHVMGNGLQTRSFIHVRDLVIILLKLIDINAIGEWNISSPVEVQIKQIAETISKLSGQAHKIIYNSSELTGIKRKIVSIEKLMKVLISYNFIDLENGINEMIEDYKLFIKNNI